jgi:hypothetical protein
MDRRKIMIVALALLLAGVAAWAFGLIGSTDPAVAQLELMRDQMFDRNLSDAERQQFLRDFRQRIESLTDDQRRAFFNSGREFRMQRAEQRMDEFFALSPADQQRQLDEMLNRMIARRNERAQNQNARNQQRDGARPSDGGGRRNRGGMTEAQRDERSKRRLDRTSPKMRAQFTEFRRQLDGRARQRGIDPGDLRGGRARGWTGRI